MRAPAPHDGIREEILRLILEDLAPRHGLADIAPDDDLIRRGVIDSLGVQEVVAFCESRYRIAIDDADLVPENFSTIERLTAFVERKLAAPVRRGRRLRRRRG